MPEAGTGLFRRSGKCAGNHRRISYIRPELVFRGSEEKSAHNANEISTFGSELVFRQIPGKLVQRHPHAQRLGGSIGAQCPLLDAIGGCVLRVPRAPARLSLATPRRLALRCRAGALPRADSRVRPKPPPADSARSLPGLGHGSSSPCTDARILWNSDQNRWVTFGE
jgi:hypothetical protein